SPIGIAPDWGDRRYAALAVAVGRDVAAEQSRCRSQRRADRAMDHRTAGGLANRIDIELGKHDGEGRAPIAGGGDPLPYRRYEDTIEIGLGDRTLARRRRLGDDRKRARFAVSQKPNEGRQHRRPSLALLSSFGCAERREADRPSGTPRTATSRTASACSPPRASISIVARPVQRARPRPTSRRARWSMAFVWSSSQAATARSRRPRSLSSAATRPWESFRSGAT